MEVLSLNGMVFANGRYEKDTNPKTSFVRNPYMCTRMDAIGKNLFRKSVRAGRESRVVVETQIHPDIPDRATRLSAAFTQTSITLISYGEWQPF